MLVFFPTLSPSPPPILTPRLVPQGEKGTTFLSPFPLPRPQCGEVPVPPALFPLRSNFAAASRQDPPFPFLFFSSLAKSRMGFASLLRSGTLFGPFLKGLPPPPPPSGASKAPRTFLSPFLRLCGLDHRTFFRLRGVFFLWSKGCSLPFRPPFPLTLNTSTPLVIGSSFPPPPPRSPVGGHSS